MKRHHGARAGLEPGTSRAHNLVAQGSAKLQGELAGRGPSFEEISRVAHDTRDAVLDQKGGWGRRLHLLI
jgi:hypothetical protein